MIQISERCIDPPKGLTVTQEEHFKRPDPSLFFTLIPNDATGESLRLPLHSSLLLLYLKNISRSDPRLAIAYWATEFLHVKSVGDLSAWLPWMSAPMMAGSPPGLLLGQGPCLFYWSSLRFHFNVTVKILSYNLNKVIILLL